MHDEEIRQIIDVLERETDGEPGKSRLFDAKPGRCSILLANRSGLLRWASLMLRAAIEPILPDDCRSKPIKIPDPHSQVCDNRADRWLGFVQRMETWPESAETIEERKRRAWRGDRVEIRFVPAKGGSRRA